MKCESCGTTLAARIRIGYYEGVRSEYCDICGDAPSVWLPDVSLSYPAEFKNGHEFKDPNLTNKVGEPIPFSSKREKAVIMKMLNLKERGDRYKGFRNEEYLHRKKYFI